MEQTTKDFYVLTLSATLFHVSSQLVAPIFPLYLLSKGASTFEIGLIISLEPLFTIFSKFFLSFLIDRSGRWPIIATSMIGQSLSMLLYSVAPSLIWLYPIRVFQTVSLALFTPAAVSIIYDLSPSTKRGDFVGKYLTSYGTATMVGPLICSILSERSVEYRGILLSSAVFSFIGVVLLFTTIPLSRMRGSQGLREGLNAVSSGNTRMLKGLMLSREGLVLTYIRMAFSLADAFFTTIFALYVSEDLLYPTSTVALLFTVKGVTNTLFRIPSGMLTDRVGRVKPLLLAYGLLALTFFLISEVDNLRLLLLTMAIYGLSHATRAVTEWALLGDFTPIEISGVSTAYFSLMFDVGGSVGSLLSGATLTSLGPGNIFKIGSVILASTLTIIPLLKKRER